MFVGFYSLLRSDVGHAAVSLRGAVVLADPRHAEPGLEARPHLPPHPVTEHHPQAVAALPRRLGGGEKVAADLPDVLGRLHIAVCTCAPPPTRVLE